MERFVAAAVQMASGADPDENLANAVRWLREAANAGAQLAVLPEVFAWRGPREHDARHHQPVPGPIVETLAALAAETGMHICMGSVLETGPDVDHAFNTTGLITPDGGLVARYRKIHLFDIDLPGRVTVRESDGRAPGSEVVAVPTALGTIGLSICYDLRFPELYRRLVAAGAEILLVPAAFTAPTGAAHWEVLCRARAVENQCWLVAANQTGTHPNGFADYGHSMIVDPWGTVVARAGDQPGIVLATIDREYTARVRRELPCLAHRRIS